jgi:hypothetical protein
VAELLGQGFRSWSQYRRVWYIPVALLLFLSPLPSCRSSHPGSQTSSQSHATNSTSNAKSTPEESTFEPPGGWLKDDQGRQYYVDKILKTKAHRLNSKTILVAWGFQLDLVREDSQYYYYKVYKPIHIVIPPPAPPISSEQRQTIIDSYKSEVKESHRLTFTPFDYGLPKSGQWRQGFAIADMNRDGHLDIILPPPRKAEVPLPSIYLGDGKGNWSLWRDAEFPPLAYDYGDVRAADLNGDGIPDLAFGVHFRGILVLFNDGKGHFRNASAGLDFDKGGKAFSSQALQIVDWNGDGRPDILALAEGPSLMGKGMHYPHGVALYFNNGGGRWHRAPGDPSDIYGRSITLGDFEGNGHPGFATATNVGDRRDIVHPWKPNGGWDTVTVNEIRPMAYIWSVASADFDGDGRADLAVAYSSFELSTWISGIDILYSRPQGRWERRALFAEQAKEGPVALGIGDLVGNGKKDLVALTAHGETLVFLADDSGFFTREKTPPPPFPDGCKGSHVELADLDGDGRDEIVSSFSDDHQVIGHCSSDGGVTAWKAHSMAFPQP